MLRNRFIIIYTLVFFALTSGIIYLGKDSNKTVISMLNIVLLLVPLVSIIFGTVHFYNSRKFIEMLLTLPINRKSIFWAEYIGLSSSLSFSTIFGVGVPLLIHGTSITGIFLVIIGIILSFIFTGLALVLSLVNNDRAKGIGFVLMIWFFFSIVFDALVLLFIYLFNDYPLQKLIFVLAILNPIDLARIIMLLKLDISALMGYTGAIFQNFFGSFKGSLFSLGLLLMWILIPALIALRIFNRKNF